MQRLPRTMLIFALQCNLNVTWSSYHSSLISTAQWVYGLWIETAPLRSIGLVSDSANQAYARGLGLGQYLSKGVDDLALHHTA
eukprot:2601372-Rhodomonas_salina.1